jgi:hypothetical protein
MKSTFEKLRRVLLIAIGASFGQYELLIKADFIG